MALSINPTENATFTSPVKKYVIKVVTLKAITDQVMDFFQDFFN